MEIALGWVGCALLPAIVLGPVLVLRYWYGASWRWVWLGIASWVVGCTAKVLIHYPCGLDQPVEGFGWQIARSTLSGLVSGTTELAAAAFFLLRARLKLADGLAFGVGIGAFEVVLLLAVAYGEPQEDVPANVPLFVVLYFPMERAATLVFHAATRLLVYAALRRRSLLIGALPLVGFVLMDGVADHGVLAGWDFHSTGVAGGFLLFLTAVTAVEALAATAAWRSLERTPDGQVVA